MKTTNFSIYSKNNLRGGISISRFPSQYCDYGGVEFPPLFPTAKLLKAYKDGMLWDSYAVIYQLQLDCLDAERTWNRLHEIAESGGADEPILLCFESAKTLDSAPCHRRLVSEWFKRELGHDVPEWSKEGTRAIAQGRLF